MLIVDQWFKSKLIVLHFILLRVEGCLSLLKLSKQSFNYAYAESIHQFPVKSEKNLACEVKQTIMMKFIITMQFQHVLEIDWSTN